MRFCAFKLGVGAGLFFLTMVSCQLDPYEISPTNTIEAMETPTPGPDVSLVTLTAPIPGMDETVPVSTLPSPTKIAIPTTTPKPSPTPILYTIVEGDTLFDIAVRYQTTVDTLISLNPDLQPELLTIGQTLILPEQSMPEPTIDASGDETYSISIDDLSIYLAPINALWILGEVHNQGDQDVEMVQVNVALHDDEGQVVHAEQVWVATTIIMAHEKAPFGILVNPAPNNDVTPEASIISVAPVVDLGNRYLDLIVDEVEIIHEGTRATISGMIVNVGQMDVSEITLTATLYDEAGNVTGFYKSIMDHILGPEDTISFKFQVLPPGSLIQDYQLRAQGIIDSAITPQ